MRIKGRRLRFDATAGFGSNVCTATISGSTGRDSSWDVSGSAVVVVVVEVLGRRLDGRLLAGLTSICASTTPNGRASSMDFSVGRRGRGRMRWNEIAGRLTWTWALSTGPLTDDVSSSMGVAVMVKATLVVRSLNTSARSESFLGSPNWKFCGKFRS